MKKFRFRLERVLQYRSTVKAEKLRDLMLRNAELRELEDRLSGLEQAQLGGMVAENSVIPVEQLYLAGMYLSRLKAEIEKTQKEIEKAKDRVAEALEIYQQAAKDEKALQTLKQKKKQEYQEYVQREETNFIDEIATIKGNTFNDQDR